MTHACEAAARRAKRLLRCYPSQWRARYGEEFAQLLIDDISEHPKSLVRTTDVIRNGLLARLSSAGLAGDSLERDQQIRVGLAVLGCALSAFLVFGVAIWSQLTVGWQWSAPAAPATKVAMLVMSAAFVVFVALALLAAVPLIWSAGRAFLGGEARGLALPLACVGIGLAALILGSSHFGHGWPGTGGRVWAGRDIVPSWVARLCWAATLWITSYWAHPHALASFPVSEIAWMAASPVALLAVLIGAAKTLRQLPLAHGILRYETWLGIAAAVAMAMFLAGASSWVVSGGPAPLGLFRVGAIDSVGVSVMAASLILAVRATQRALAARSNGS